MKKFFIISGLFLFLSPQVLAASPDNIPVICKVKIVQSSVKNNRPWEGNAYFFINDVKKELYTTVYGNNINGTTNTFNKQLILITNARGTGLNYVKIDRITGKINFKEVEDNGTAFFEGTCYPRTDMRQNFTVILGK